MNDRALARMVRALVEPIRRRVMMTVGRAVVRAINDDLGRQVVQIEVLRGEVRDAVERMQNYGFTSVPLAGADAAVVFVAGNREQGIVVAIDDRRYRLTGLEAGEVAIYDDQGQKVHITRTGILIETDLDLTATVGGSAEVTASTSITLTSPTVTIDGDLVVTGDVDATGTVTGTTDVVGGGITLSTHVHSGVIPGMSNSGGPV